MKKFILKILEMVIIASFLILTVGFVKEKNRQVKCVSININILDSADNKFVKRDEVLGIIEKADMKILGFPLYNFNTDILEKKIEEFPPVKMAEVYYNAAGVLNIDIAQRKPLLRVIDERGKGYYVDRDGIIMKLSDKYSSFVMLANGNIPKNFNIRNGLSLFDKEKEDAPSGNKVLKDLYAFASYVEGDKFWASQIVQVYVNNEGEYELIPRVGAHVIYLGGMDSFKYKLKKLKAIYDKNFGKKGWNSYEKIYLQYSNQVICTKR